MSPKVPELWPHQSSAIASILSHIAKGVRRIVITSPTGGGKSRIVAELIRHLLETMGWKSVTYTNRKMLVEQLTGTLRAFGLEVGVRAAGQAKDDDIPTQVCSIQTEHARVTKRKDYLKWDMHPADIVFVDEAHLNSGAKDGSAMQTIKDRHAAAGAVIIEVTATPIDLDGKAEVMVVAGTNSELRECGALVPAMHFGPDEPDLHHIGVSEMNKTDDLSEPQVKRLMGAVDKAGEPDIKLKRLFGRVTEWFEKLNPERKPTILFAPGVAESRWFAKEFCDLGIAAAHIDGDDIWTESSGDVKANRASREELLEMSKDGTIKVLCNRFVLREGIDCPWLQHGVFATAFGSLQSYLQSGGRLLRSHPGIQSVTIQDHGGNWWRHGSLNADRHWPLGCSGRMIAGERADSLREKKQKEPLRCPKCSLILMGLRCVCGFVLDPRAKMRPVVQENGSLIMMEGDIFRPRRTERKADTLEKWKREYFRARNGGMTFRQAIGNFFREHGYWPPNDMPMMPKVGIEQWSKVADIPRQNLHQEG